MIFIIDTKDDKFFRKVEKNCWCLNERCKDMKETNVDVQVLSTVPVMFNYWAKPEHTLDLSRLLNDDLALQIRLNKNDENNLGKSFYGFGTLPMQDSIRAVEEMTRLGLHSKCNTLLHHFI